jgi:hypothetical protein
VAPALFIVLFAIAGLLLRLVASLEMTNEARLALNLIGGIGALVFPVVVYSIIDLKLTQRAVSAVGVKESQKVGAEFVRVEMHKNHFTLVTGNAKKKDRRKFRVCFVFSTWQVKTIEWLK